MTARRSSVGRWLRICAGLLVAGCAASPARPSAAPTRLASTVVVRPSVDNPDSVADAIAADIEARTGVAPRVLARIGDEDRQLVFYAMNGLDRWLADQPEREARRRAIAECEAEGPQEDEPNCAERVLRDLRRPILRERFMARWCADTHAAPGCGERFDETVVFDVEGRCERGFWAVAHRGGEGWTSAPLRASEELCLERLVDVRAVDLDGDGSREILLDAIYAELDASELLTRGYDRDVRALRWDGGASLSTLSVTQLGYYAGDLGYDEQRCTYALSDSSPRSMERTCCSWTGEGEPGPRFATTLGDGCRRFLPEILPPREGGGFARCRRTLSESAEGHAREAPRPDAEVLFTFARGRAITAFTRRGDWLEVDVPDDESGWIRADQTERRCPDARAGEPVRSP